MKKYKFLIDFFIGGSIFIISTILATFISLLFMGEGISTVIAFKGIEYISLFVLGGTIFTIMKYLFDWFTKFSFEWDYYAFKKKLKNFIWINKNFFFIYHIRFK